MNRKTRFVMLMLTALVLGLTVACVEDVHIHTWASEYSNNDIFHWLDATCEHEITTAKERHTFETVENNPATHDEAGSMKYRCSVCGYEKTVVVPATDTAHTFASAWVYDSNSHWHAATCSHTDVKGSLASHSFTVVSAGEVKHGIDFGDDYEDYVAAQEVTYRCSVCFYEKTVIEEVTGEAADIHTYSPNYSHDETYHWNDATCCDNGIEINRARHTFTEEVVSEATCSAAGLIRHTCQVCGYTYDEIVPIDEDAHSFSDNWSYVTVLDVEYHYHAATCEHSSITKDYGTHTPEESVVIPATHTAPGSKNMVCSVCGKILETGIEIPADEDAHTYATAWTTDDTYHWHDATCGHSVVSAKDEHDWVEDENYPNTATYTKGGTKGMICSVCSKTKTVTTSALVLAGTAWTNSDGSILYYFAADNKVSKYELEEKTDLQAIYVNKVLDNVSYTIGDDNLISYSGGSFTLITEEDGIEIDSEEFTATTEHEHTFNTVPVPTEDKNNHYFEAACEHSGYITDYGPHEFTDGVCACGVTYEEYTHEDQGTEIIRSFKGGINL